MPNNLQGVVYSLENHLYDTQTHTGRHTRWHVINIVSCRGSFHVFLHQLLSLEQQMCGRHSRGKATWLTTLLIKTCRPASASKCVCLCTCLCVCVCYAFPISTCVRVVRVCVQAQVRAGKDAVYEIGVIYLGHGGGCWGAVSTAGNIQTQEKKRLWSMVKKSRWVSFFNNFNKWVIPTIPF